MVRRSWADEMDSVDGTEMASHVSATPSIEVENIEEMVPDQNIENVADSSATRSLGGNMTASSSANISGRDNEILDRRVNNSTQVNNTSRSQNSSHHATFHSKRSPLVDEEG